MPEKGGLSFTTGLELKAERVIFIFDLGRGKKENGLVWFYQLLLQLNGNSMC